MKRFLFRLSGLVIGIRGIAAKGEEWAQCSEKSTECNAGLLCVKVDESYSQCRNSESSVAATGFVGVSGQKFVLDGADFTVVGTNAYWLAQLSSASAITTAWNEIKSSGATVLRTWGFNDVTSSSSSGTFYQVWNNGVGTLNTGANGLQKFDTVVAGAKAAGIRLIVALTNNWKDYGGMDVYVSQLGAGSHNNFYTNQKTKDAYKKYVNGFVSRYKDEPTIMAWELANEPRCQGCPASTLTNWASEMSAYIKSIDPNHLVALGDEGFFNKGSGADYPYQGSEGVDFDANLKIATLDFGTVHAYPTSWGVTSGIPAWGQKWINDHAASQKAVGKPVIIEEYGITGSSQVSTYQTWWSTIISSGLTGDLYWQAATSVSGSGFNDGLGITPGSAAFKAVQQHSQDMKSRTL